MLIARTVDSCPQHQDLVLVCYLVANVPRSLVTVSAARVLSQNTFVGIGHGVGAWVLRVRTNIVHVAEGLALFPPYYAIN
jgi:hypothetical protein